jgi:hypothetical protein
MFATRFHTRQVKQKNVLRELTSREMAGNRGKGRKKADRQLVTLLPTHRVHDYECSLQEGFQVKTSPHRLFMWSANIFGEVG